MIRALARASIRNGVLVHMLIAGLLLVGTWSLLNLPRELMSEISFNWVFIRVDYPSAAAQEVEQQIAMPVEEAIERVEAVSSVSSRSKEGYAFFSVKFEDVDDDAFDGAYQELKDEVGAVVLPEDAEEPFWVNFSSQDFVPMVQVVVAGDLPRKELFELVSRVEDDIEAIDGIGKIERGGVQDRRIRVEVDPDRLSAYGLPISAVGGALAASNINIPGGLLSVGGSEYLLRTVGQWDAVERIGEVVVGASPGGGLVKVSDIAAVVDDYEDRSVITRFEGRTAATLSISKQAGGNSIALIEQIRALVDDWNGRLDPDEVRLSISGDSSIQIRNMLSDLETNAAFGMALVVLVLWLFLGLRNALLTALGIPLAFLATFIFMRATGASLNGNSLFGLVLVLGIIVDDAIVIVENASRHRAMGKAPTEAIVDGVGEVGVPVAAAILTTIAAFLPLMLMPGLMGKFMRIIPIVVSMALVASLVEALVSLPCHIHEWGEQDPKRLERRAAWFQRFVLPYRRALQRLVQTRVPYPAQRSGGRALGLRLLGWVGALVPLTVVLGGLGAGAGYGLGLGRGLVGEALIPFATGGAAAGFGGVLVGLLALSLWTRSDFAGTYGIQIANAAGLAFTALLFVVGGAAAVSAALGPVAGVALVALAGLGSLAAVLVLAFRGRLAGLAVEGFGRLRAVRFSVLSAVYLGMIPLAALIGAMVDLDLFGGDEVPQFSVQVRLPEGTPLTDTSRVVREMERLVAEGIPAAELESVTTHAGLLMTDSEWFIKPNVGQVVVDLVQPAERDRAMGAIIASVRPAVLRVPGPASVELIPRSSGPPAGADIELKVQGDDLDRLVELSELVAVEMGAVDGVVDVRSDWVLGKRELRVDVDPERAALLGVNERDVGLALRYAFEGIEATRFQDDGEDVPVVVRYGEAFRDDLSWIQRTPVPAQGGGSVPFRDVAEVREARGVDAVRRYLGDRTISLTASVDETKTTSISATRAVQARLADFSERFPGYRINYSGEFEEFQKSLEALLTLGMFGLILVYMILGAQFRSFVQPVIIIGFTFPGALLGSALALLITGTPLSILTLYGLVALLGIVVNDSLVLVSFINQERARGRTPVGAILEAGRVRLRPIVLTTVTTVFGLLPMALGLGGKSAAWGPLATTIACGLLFATATTLLVIPPVYRCFVDLEELGQAAWAALLGRDSVKHPVPTVPSDDEVVPGGIAAPA